jgi:hypothetical protein
MFQDLAQELDEREHELRQAALDIIRPDTDAVAQPGRDLPQFCSEKLRILRFDSGQ